MSDKKQPNSTDGTDAIDTRKIVKRLSSETDSTPVADPEPTLYRFSVPREPEDTDQSNWSRSDGISTLTEDLKFGQLMQIFNDLTKIAPGGPAQKIVADEIEVRLRSPRRAVDDYLFEDFA